MSMKSFDKFCERMIMGEAVNQKEIFDERQKIMRLKISVEALLIFGGSVLLNCFIMEEVYMWAESQLAAMALLMTSCLLYWQIRCAAKGCMIGTNGKFAQTYTGIFTIIMAVLMFIRGMDKLGEPDFIIKNGALSKDFVVMAVVFMYMALGIFTLCAVRHESRRGDGEEEKK